MESVLEKAAAVRLAVFDVDGVMTRGEICTPDQGEETRTFWVQDGLGLKLLAGAGCHIAVISARTSIAVSRRMDELGIPLVYQGANNKLESLQTILARLDLDFGSVAYTGDDLTDLPAMKRCGLAIAVANAHSLVKQHAHWVTGREGGAGAVREICELLLGAQGKLERIFNEYLQ